MCERESQERQTKRIERLLRQSCLPLEKSLETFDLKRLPAKLARQVQSLRHGDAVERKENLLAFGNPGSGKTHLLCGLAFSSDSKWIVSGGDGGFDDDKLKTWDVKTGREIMSRTGHERCVTSVAFNSDGKKFVTGSYDELVKVWDAGTGKELLSLKGHADFVETVCFSPDGKRIASGGHDKTAKLWNATTGQIVLTLKHPGWVNSLAFSPNGKWIATGCDDETVKVWDAARGELVRSLKGHSGRVMSVSFSPDGKWIVSGGGRFNEEKPGEAIVWDASTGEKLLILKGHTDIVSSVAISADGKQIATASWDKTVKVWEIGDGQ